LKLGRFELKLTPKEPYKIQNKIKTGLKVLFERKEELHDIGTNYVSMDIRFFKNYYPISVICLFVIHWFQLLLLFLKSFVISCKDIKKINQFNFGFQYN
jgi:hypothetical protein